MARTPDIAVRVRADGITRTIASFKAMQATVVRSLSLVAKAAQATTSTLSTLAKPVQITVRGLRDVTRTAVGLAALAAALAGIEGRSDIDAGAAVKSMQAGLKVAVDQTSELTDRIAELRKELAEVGSTGDFGGVRDRLWALEDQLSAGRDVDKTVDKQWRELIATANSLGVEISRIGPAYVGLANATKGTAAAGETTKRTFRGMIMAGSALGRTSEEVEGGLLALQQIAGKGKVSMEELRQQLGERLPGAMNIAARAMSVTPQELEAMVAKGLDASLFLDKFSRQLEKEFGPAAEAAAKRPEAAFARLRNSIFLARSEVANGGLSASLARIAQNATVVIDRMAQSGQLANIGARIGAGLERLPSILMTVGERLMLLGRYAREWWRQMGVAVGIDMSGWGDQTAGSLGTVLDVVKQLAFDIPGIIYALRMAFSGQDDNVAERYAWILPIRDVIINNIIPALQQVPQFIRDWGPAFLAAGQTVMSIMESIHGIIMSVFGNETGRKIIAFLVIAKVVGLLNLLGAALSLVFAGIRALAIAVVISRLMSALTGVAAGAGAVAQAVRVLLIVLRYLRLALLIFATPAGLVVLVIAALAALAYAIYSNWDTIKVYLAAAVTWISEKFAALVDGFKSLGSTLLDWLLWPYKKAWEFISSIFEKIAKLWESASWSSLLKGGEIVISSAKKAVGLAKGGYLARGPGTTTSDSIPAMLSRKEGVVNAQATAHYGGKAFIDGLNTMSLPRFEGAESVIDVQSGRPGRPVNFAWSGVGTASGMADDNLADSLGRLFDSANAGRGRQRKSRGYR